MPSGDSLIEVSDHDREDVGFSYLCGNDSSVVGGKLCAVIPVNLVAVVRLGVVGGGDVYSGNRTKLTQSERKLGSGAGSVENVGFLAVCGKNAGGHTREKLGVVSRVARNDNAFLLAVIFLYESRNALGCLSDGVDVHSADTALHNASESGSAERKRSGKALLYFVVVSLDAVDILAERFLKVLVVAPSAVFVCV